MNGQSRRAVLRASLATALIGSTLLASVPALAAPTVGQAAPNFVAIDSKGQRHRLEDYKGKVVVLEWTNHGCPYVKKHYNSSNMQNLQRQAKQAGVIWLSVISSAPGEQGYVEPEKANELTASRNAAPTAVLIDPPGSIGKSYDARTTPHMYVIDAKGILRYAGGIDSIASTDTDDIAKAQPYFKAAMESVVKGQPVAQPVTRPYGCNVKYSI